MTHEPMTHELLPFADLARATGRFEMQTVAHPGYRADKSSLGIEEARALGLFDAAGIWLPRPEIVRPSLLKAPETIGFRGTDA